MTTETGAQHDPYAQHDLRAVAQRPSEEDRTWAAAAHAGGLAGVLAGGILGVVAPIVVLLSRGSESTYARRNAVQALNFQLTMLLVGIVGGIAGVVVTILTLGLALLVVVPTALAYVGFALVVMVLALVRAAQGEDYRYPLSIPFVR